MLFNMGFFIIIIIIAISIITVIIIINIIIIIIIIITIIKRLFTHRVVGHWKRLPKVLIKKTKPDRAQEVFEWHSQALFKLYKNPPEQGQDLDFDVPCGSLLAQDILWFYFLRSKIIAVDIENTIATSAGNHHSKWDRPWKFQALKT